MAHVKSKSKKKSKNISRGIVHVSATFNNTIITVTDTKGNAISWCTSGASGFKGSKKSTPFAAQVAAETAVKKAQDQGLKEVDVVIKGPGGGRESAVRALQVCGVKVNSIKDITPIPHNGCRPKKRRRV